MLPQLESFARFALLDGPSPIQRLEKLERALAAQADPPRIHVKRDDLGGIGGGGNKLRKLEFLVGEALRQGCDTFITTGARQSNHARLTAASAARAGLHCELALADLVPRTDDAYLRNGNVLLDGLFGAQVQHLPGDADTLAYAQQRAVDLRKEGRQAYVVGAGGSSPLGCLGYAACAAEIAGQERDLGRSFDRIVIPNGSSGTHAGLVAGFSAMGMDASRVRSFTVLAPQAQALTATTDLARRAAALIDPEVAVAEDDVHVLGGQRGEGYGVPTDAMRDAVRLLARTEGLLIDPVYGGKAFAGLLAAIRDGELNGNHSVLFVMTGGTPGLFAYEPAFRADPTS